MKRALVSFASAFAGLVPAAGSETPKAQWKQANCKHGHGRKAGLRGIARALHHHRPLTARDGRRAWHFARCTNTRRQSHRLTIRLRDFRAWRRSYAHRWPIKFNSLPASDQAWAYSTGACESGNNPSTNTGNGFSGAFQFMPATWWSAGGTGLPHQHSWHYQAVVAVRWMHVAGRSQWPVCG